jgi:hypothetical protein
MQDPRAPEGSVGFRCVADDPEPDRPSRAAAPVPVLRLATDFDAAVAEARERRVPIFLSLLYDTCGQCDRTVAEVFRDPRFVAYCNERLVVVVGHVPHDAEDRPHAARPDGSCTVHTGLSCETHEALFARGLAVVGGFRVSPGNFLLDPFRAVKGAGREALLSGEERLPKGGADIGAYLEAFEAGAAALRDLNTQVK